MCLAAIVCFVIAAVLLAGLSLPCCYSLLELIGGCFDHKLESCNEQLIIKLIYRNEMGRKIDKVGQV